MTQDEDRNPQSIDPNTANLITKIMIIGDVVEDEVSIAYNGRIKSKTFFGGAAYVKKMLHSGLKELNIDIEGYDEYKKYADDDPQLDTFQESSLYKISPLYKTPLELTLKRSLDGKSGSAFRIKSPEAHIKSEQTNQKIVLKLPADDSIFDMLVIKDLGIKENSTNDWESCVERLLERDSEQFQRDGNSFFPRLFLMINHSSSEFSVSNQKGSCFYDSLLNQEGLKQKTLAIIYADILRVEDVSIGKRISIERTVQDFLSELHTDPTLKRLGEFQHLIIRFGLLAAVHSYRIDKRRFHRLFFDPVRIYKPEYFLNDKGVVTGNQAVFITCIIKELIKYVNFDSGNSKNQYNEYGITERIGEGVKQAIDICRHRHDHGFGSESDESKSNQFDIPLNFLDFNNSNPIESFENLDNSFNTKQFKNAENQLKIADERIPVAHPAWSILVQSAEYDLLTVAEAIVDKGVESTLNQPESKKTVWSPIGIFGSEKKFVVLERNELESYRCVQRLMEQAMNEKKGNILSIAVFGPPGSGKSFSSERIAESAAVSAGRNLKFEKINLASLNELSQLQSKLNDIKNKIIEDRGKEDRDKVDHDKDSLVIFFDEFDSSLGEKNLGWLKYFLPIMQDGELTPVWNVNKDELKLKPIFIFAGGTSHTYLDFSREDLSIDEEEKAKFAMAKGPDFVSRLKGHIDILGPNKVSEYDDAYVVRRAILLRTYFKQVLEEQNIGKEAEKEISLITDGWVSSAVVRAMLTVSRYKHGARSMQAIIEMCIKISNGRIVTSSLPTPSQLNMHVDANEFLVKVGSARLEIRAKKYEDKTSE